jgi:hypothetical protein
MKSKTLLKMTLKLLFKIIGPKMLTLKVARKLILISLKDIAKKTKTKTDDQIIREISKVWMDK